MGDVLTFPAHRTATAGRRVKQVIQKHRETFRKGDVFTSENGVKISVQDERVTERGRELLYCAHGDRVWASDTRFVPAFPEDGVA